MKVIGRGINGAYLCEISREEIEALKAGDVYSDGCVSVGEELDVLKRLKPTLEFARDRNVIPRMAAHIRAAADELEKAFA